MDKWGKHFISKICFIKLSNNILMINAKKLIEEVNFLWARVSSLKHKVSQLELKIENGNNANNTAGYQMYQGGINSVFIYSIPLTASQVLQNYNALKSRYGR